MALPTGVAGVSSPLNISGLLFNKTKIDTPLFNSIPRTYDVQSRIFLTGATYDTGYPNDTVAGISETASLTAPTPNFWTRENAYNLTQIFQRSVQVSYRKQSNASDLNAYGESATAQPAIAGNTNNVPNELAFQLANTVDKIRLDMEYCILNGEYQDSAGDPDTADQTRGIIEAISTNTIAASNAELNFGLLYDLAEKIMLSGSPYGLDSYLFVVSFTQYKQLQKIAADEGLKISKSSAGINVSEIITPFGIMRFLPHRFLAAGTLVAICMPVMANAMQPVPGKGNFFYEPLAKTGASEHGQVYGQWGLDYGPEFLHAKITGLATTTADFTAPKRYIVNGGGEEGL